MGDRKFANLLLCCLLRASSPALRRGEKKATVHRLDLAPIIANGLATNYLQFVYYKRFIFVFSTQVIYFNLSLNLSFTPSDFMFCVCFPKLSNMLD